MNCNGETKMNGMFPQDDFKTEVNLGELYSKRREAKHEGKGTMIFICALFAFMVFSLVAWGMRPW